jgi:hypothetical protein
MTPIHPRLVETKVEPTTSMPEEFESPTDKFRRGWAENGADWSWQVLKFLQGRRINEISLTEIEQTKTFARATELEKSSLRFVASQAEQRNPLSYDDRIRLRERDDFLMRFVENKTLGHMDWISEIMNIPAAVQRAQEVDARLFPNTFTAPELFSWVWRPKS